MPTQGAIDLNSGRKPVQIDVSLVQYLLTPSDEGLMRVLLIEDDTLPGAAMRAHVRADGPCR